MSDEIQLDHSAQGCILHVRAGLRPQPSTRVSARAFAMPRQFQYITHLSAHSRARPCPSSLGILECRTNVHTAWPVLSPARAPAPCQTYAPRFNLHSAGEDHGGRSHQVQMCPVQLVRVLTPGIILPVVWAERPLFATCPPVPGQYSC